MEFADCEQNRCVQDASGYVEQEYAADVVREVYADGEFGGAVNQRNHSLQQTRNEEVVEEDREPTARARLRVEQVRQGEDHGWHQRQKDAVRPNNTRALHDVSTKEKLLCGGLDRSENQCDRHEERERCEVKVKREGVGIEEVLSQPSDQPEWHEPRHKPVTDTPPTYPLPRRDQRSGVATVNEGDGDQDSHEEERKNCRDRNEAPHGTECGVIQPTERRQPLLTTKQERDAGGGDAADHKPHKEDDY